MSIISPSFWQNTDWKTFRENCGEKTFIFENKNAKALIIEKSPHVLKFWKKKIWELQRGPYGEKKDFAALFFRIFCAAKKQGIERVRIFPPLGEENFWREYKDMKGNFIFSEVSRITPAPEIFSENTLVLDLTLPEDEILGQMKQKGRYNIKQAKKKGVEIFEEKNIENFWRILQETAKRDGFITNKKFVYQQMIKSYGKNATLLSARDETGEVLASKIFCVSGDMGIYYYGASSSRKRNLMAPYLLQWEGIRWAKKMGATQYDFLGISPENNENHQLSSVTQFKLKFGGERIISDKGIDFWV
jgi:lipid II:glycine glycyltransferase (peptidoglycan interpeptide bridge formation enzyme)